MKIEEAQQLANLPRNILQDYFKQIEIEDFKNTMGEIGKQQIIAEKQRVIEAGEKAKVELASLTSISEK